MAARMGGTPAALPVRVAEPVAEQEVNKCRFYVQERRKSLREAGPDGISDALGP